MFLRLTEGRVDPIKVDQVVAIVRDALAAMKQRPGFQSGYYAINRKAGTGLITSLWDTEEHASYTVPPESLVRLEALGLQSEPITVSR
jgi:hypothetical protein